MNTRKRSLVAVSILVVLCAPAAPAFAQHAAHAIAQAPAPTKVTDTEAALRDLWMGHIFWVRNVVVDTLAGNTAAAAASEQQVVANAKQIAAAIEPYYGKAASEKLFGLLAGHYGAVKQYLEATAADSKGKQDAAVKNLTGNATEIAKFLSSANPNLPFDTLNGLLLAHGGHHVQEIQQLYSKEYAQEAQTWEAMTRHMYVIADALAGSRTGSHPRSERSKIVKILMVLTSHDKLGNTGRKTGFWLEEFAAPYYTFLDAGATVTVASPKGGQPPLDPVSDTPEGQTDLTQRFKQDPAARAVLANTLRLSDVKASDYDAVFYPGGHGPMWDLAEDPRSIALIEAFYNAGKPVAAVCHAPGVLHRVQFQGQPIVKGKRVTGFTNGEEEAVHLTKVVPFLVEDELKRLGGLYEKVEDWKPFVVTDGRLVTGQNPASSTAGAEALLKLLSPDALTPARFIDRFEQINGVHSGFRRNHAKGLGVSGFFESNGNGVRLSKSAAFEPGRVPVIGRFSLDGGQPYQSDRPSTRRGLGLQFSLPNGELWRTAMINFPLFPVRTPGIFYERLLAFKQDPATGMPDPAQVKAFEERHPETVEVLKKITAEPQASGFGNTTFHGLNTFLFTNSAGKTTPVRWILNPMQPFEAAGAAPPDKDYLFDELITQIHRQPLRWRLIIIVGKPGDPTNDPSIGWPADREQVDVGTLTLDRVEAEELSAATDIVFDPLMLPAGIAPSDDPVLRVRSGVYVQSHTRRAGETKQPSAITPADVMKGEKTNGTTKRILLTRRSPAYWRVTFDHPPLNIFGPEMIPQLNEIITALEKDEQVKVVVFDSAVDGFFLTHYDFLAKSEDTTRLPPGPTGLQQLPDMLVRLSRAPVVSIVSIRGRATGVGSELALASDMRFASREKAVLSQWEVGAGLVPGGGPMARLPRLIGRGRALEVLLGADDIGGDLAERYGYVNRSLPDAELDTFVDALATRIASFDKQAIAETKRLVNLNSLPPDAEIAPEWDAFLASLGRPAAQARIRMLFERGFHKPGDIETRLGYHVGQLRSAE